MKKKAQEESASVEAKAIASTQDPRMKLLLLRKEKKKQVDLSVDKYCLHGHLGTLTSYSLSQLKVQHSVIRHGPVGFILLYSRISYNGPPSYMKFPLVGCVYHCK
jgi:hypothetical protein